MIGWHWFATPEGAADLLRAGRCHHTTWNIPAGACDECRLAIVAAAVEIERAAVVEWMRYSARFHDPDGPWGAGLCDSANRIEAGDHRA